MREVKRGRKLLRLLLSIICLACLASALSGCSDSRYQAVDLSETGRTQNEENTVDMTMISMGGAESASER